MKEEIQIQILLSKFSNTRRNRLRMRKEIFKVLRENRSIFSRNGNTWLLRKMDYGYMKDLSDPRLIGLLEHLLNEKMRMSSNKIEYDENLIFDQNQIVT